jgi:hypothetical protein
MYSLQPMFDSMCLNIDILFCFRGSGFADHLTLPIFTLGFRRILFKRHWGGKNTNRGKFIFFFLEIKLNKFSFHVDIVSYSYSLHLCEQSQHFYKIAGQEGLCDHLRQLGCASSHQNCQDFLQGKNIRGIYM